MGPKKRNSLDGPCCLIASEGKYSLLHGNCSLEVGNLFQWFSCPRRFWNCVGMFPFQWALQRELGKVPRALNTIFFEVPTFPGVGNTKHVDKYVEFPTKQEPLLKASQ